MDKTFQLYWGADRLRPSLETDTCAEACGFLSDEDQIKLDSLDVGQAFVDEEGDEWVRIA